MSNARRNSTPASTPAELEFDVTQQIDPALADLLRPNSEPTLTSSDFDDVEIAIEPRQRPPSPRR
jgi:hypothetical protein